MSHEVRDESGSGADHEDEERATEAAASSSGRPDTSLSVDESPFTSPAMETIIGNFSMVKPAFVEHHASVEPDQDEADDPALAPPDEAASPFTAPDLEEIERGAPASPDDEQRDG